MRQISWKMQTKKRNNICFVDKKSIHKGESMKFKSLLIVSTVLLGIFFAGCTISTDSPAPKKQSVAKKPKVMQAKKQIDPVDRSIAVKKKELSFLRSNPIKEFAVVGEGIAPQNTISPAQALALAKRAAVADAYRQLGEKLYGVKVNAKETVKDAALKNSKIITQVDGLIKDAYITESSYKDGLYRVKMELKIDSKTWKRIFSY